MMGNLAEELRRIRGIRNVSLREVEKATGISNAYLSQLERGGANKPSPSILHKLSQFYEVPYESLMETAGYMEQPKSRDGEQKKMSAIQAALLSADLTEEENKLVASYIGYIRSQRK